MNPTLIEERWHAAVAALRPLPGPRPPLSAWAWRVDVPLAVLLAIGTVATALARSHVDPEGYGSAIAPVAPNADPLVHYYPPAQWWQLVLAALVALPLAARRRWPLAVLWVVSGASFVYHLDSGFDPTVTFAACVIAACSAVLHSPYRVLAMVGALVDIGLMVGEHKESVPAIRPGIVTMLLLVLAGFAVYTWRQRMRAMAEEQRSATERALAEERSRIARELHDVVTHNVSMMVVQVGAARTAMAVAPERANTALRNVESVGRAAMTELRHIMGLLTMNTDNPEQVAAAELSPPPGLAQVDALVDRVRNAGTQVRLSVSLPEQRLPAGVDLAAYRVVQEALTNVGRHAAGAAVTVTVDHTPRELRVEVADTGGVAAGPAEPGSGRGLIGLRERLAVYGGSLTAEKLPTAGYRVCAAIPLELP